jgi:hypothetical protein
MLDLKVTKRNSEDSAEDFEVDVWVGSAEIFERVLQPFVTVGYTTSVALLCVRGRRCLSSPIFLLSGILGGVWMLSLGSTVKGLKYLATTRLMTTNMCHGFDPEKDLGKGDG